jgi:hypothetical protein
MKQRLAFARQYIGVETCILKKYPARTHCSAPQRRYLHLAQMARTAKPMPYWASGLPGRTVQAASWCEHGVIENAAYEAGGDELEVPKPAASPRQRTARAAIAKKFER